MAKLLQLRRGTTTQHGSFTGAEGEVTIDTTKDTAVVHDGSQAGGRPLLREDMANLPAGTIDNADVNSSAAIAGTKISPDFGSQDITTTGNIVGSGGYLEIQGTQPQLRFNDTNHENDYEIQNSDGTFAIRDIDANANRITIAADGTTRFKASSVVAEQGFNCQGALIVSGTVDGRDVAADGTKLDGIESGSTAEQTKSDIDGLNINADQVDGLHASSFLRSDTADTATSDITFMGGAGAITLDDNSDIRSSYGNWTGEAAKIQWHSNHVYISASQNFYFRDSDSSATQMVVDSSGNLTATGNVTAYSDVRLKTDISTINDALGICGKLRGVSYKWIATDLSLIHI